MSLKTNEQTQAGRRWQTWLVVVFWALGIAAFWGYAQVQGAGVTALLQNLLEGVARSPWGPFGLLAVFLVRPLLLLPITILNVFAGFLFGPVWGLAYALVATLLSSTLAYGVARVLKVAPQTEAGTGFLDNLRTRSFETVLTGRLLFLPGDLINYAAGFFGISFTAFLLATALGGLPGLMISVLAGASIEGQFNFQGVRINLWYLLASVGMLIFSLGLSYWLRRRSGTT